jgi:hypothetical protein
VTAEVQNQARRSPGLGRFRTWTVSSIVGTQPSPLMPRSKTAGG